MSTNSGVIDTSAIGLSGLCLIHCLALPAVSAFLPAVGVLAEAEWVHQLLVLLALPVTVYAIIQQRALRKRTAFVLPASVGLSLLLAAAFAESLHDYETALTVAGAVVLASAHIWRWSRRDDFSCTQ